MKVTAEISTDSYKIILQMDDQTIEKRYRKTSYGSEGLDTDWEFDDRIESDGLADYLSDLSAACSDVMDLLEEEE